MVMMVLLSVSLISTRAPGKSKLPFEDAVASSLECGVQRKQVRGT